MERRFGLLDTQFYLEHPQCLGDNTARSYQHFIGFCQTLQALYLHHTTPNQGYCRIGQIRG